MSSSPPRATPPEGAPHAPATRVRLHDVEHDGARWQVTLQIVFDGVEHLGRLWFSSEGEGEPLADRSVLPGRSRDEVVSIAERLRPEEILQRLARATSEKRRFFELRRTTDDVLLRIRYLNQLAVAMRLGLIDIEGAAQELDQTEEQLHALVRELRASAGVVEKAGTREEGQSVDGR